MYNINDIMYILKNADRMGLNKQVDAIDLRLAQVVENNNFVTQQQYTLLMQQIQMLNKEIQSLRNAMQEMIKNYSNNATIPQQTNLTVKSI